MLRYTHRVSTTRVYFVTLQLSVLIKVDSIKGSNFNLVALFPCLRQTADIFNYWTLLTIEIKVV